MPVVRIEGVSLAPSPNDHLYDATPVAVSLACTLAWTVLPAIVT